MQWVKFNAGALLVKVLRISNFECSVIVSPPTILQQSKNMGRIGCGKKVAGRVSAVLRTHTHELTHTAVVTYMRPV